MMTPEHDATPMRFADWLRCGVAFGYTVLCGTYLDVYANYTWNAPDGNTYALVLLAFAGGLVLSDLRRPLQIARSPVMYWLLAYAASSAWAWWTPPDSATIEFVISRFRGVLFILSMMVVLDDRRARKAAVLGMIAVILIATATNLAEAFGGVVFNDPRLARTFGRASGFFFNSNEAARAIVFGLALAVLAIPVAWRVPLVLVAAVGIAPTFSRGTWIAFAVVVLWLIVKREIRISLYAILVVVSVVTVIEVKGQVVGKALEATGVISEATTERLQFGMRDSSATERMHLAEKAWDMFARSPILGSGLGASQRWDEKLSSHNSYLNLAADHGAFGLLLYPMLVLMLILANRRVLPFPLVLFVVGFFAHNILEERYVDVAIALSAVMSDLVRPARSRASPTHELPAEYAAADEPAVTLRA